MELLTPETIQPLGLSGIFVIFISILWRTLWKLIEQKDARIKELTDNLAAKYEANTHMQNDVKNIMSGIQHTLDRNTDALERFSSSMRGTRD